MSATLKFTPTGGSAQTINNPATVYGADDAPLGEISAEESGGGGSGGSVGGFLDALADAGAIVKVSGYVDSNTSTTCHITFSEAQSGVPSGAIIVWKNNIAFSDATKSQPIFQSVRNANAYGIRWSSTGEIESTNSTGSSSAILGADGITCVGTTNFKTGESEPGAQVDVYLTGLV